MHASSTPSAAAAVLVATAVLFVGPPQVTAAQPAPPGSPGIPAATPSTVAPAPVTRQPVRPLQDAPPLPGRDGVAPRPRPMEERTGGDGGPEEEESPVRTADPDEGGTVLQPRRLPSMQSRPVRGLEPQIGTGPPPPRPGAARTTGDEDEMEDLDIQRRTAPGDLGDTPLPTPSMPQRQLRGTQPAVGTGAVAPPRSGAARTTGDEDEMEDLDIQRRTAPSDLGDTPLPAPGAPLIRRGKDAAAGVPMAVGGASLPPGAVVAPATIARPEGGPTPPPLQQPVPPPPPRATVQAPPRAKAGDWITVSWAGPGRNRDYVVVALPDAPATARDSFAYANAYNAGPRALRVPPMPGTVEVRYIDEATGEILARATVQIVP